MQEIRLKDINFESLKRISSNWSTYATVYTDGDVCYKIFNDPHSFDNVSLYNNFKDMDGMQIDGVILPEDLIVDDGVLLGYLMPLFKDSMTLSRRFEGRYVDKALVVSAFRKASFIIREMHKKGVILQDVSLENILINDQGDVCVCDPDSFAYNGYFPQTYSKIFCRFLIDYRKTKLHMLEDIDRLSLFLAFYYLMFEKEIQKVSRGKYNKLSSEMKTVENMREIRDLLVDKSKDLYDLPYFDEFASNLDVGTLDKNKCLTIGQKVYNAVERRFQNG